MNCILLLFYSFVNYKCRDYNNSNNVDSMKWIQRKHLAGYILAYCIVLVSSLTLLAGFAVQSLLAKFLCQLVSMEEGISWECNCAWYQPYAKIWVDKAEGTTNVFFWHLHVVHIAPLLSTCRVTTTYTVRLLVCLN